MDDIQADKSNERHNLVNLVENPHRSHIDIDPNVNLDDIYVNANVNFDDIHVDPNDASIVWMIFMLMIMILMTF